MSAIEPEERGAHSETTGKLFRAVRSIEELPNGYRFRLPNESEVLLSAAQFIALERRCCPFFDFGLQIEREGGAIWLSLTGSEGVKSFIMAEVGEHLFVNIQNQRGGP
ncbi:MAG: hypothetical protein ABR501_09720 [Pyrinomonadaceae bacterium]